MESDGKLKIVLNLPLADTPDMRQRVIESLNNFVNETVTKIALESISLQ
ncbi:MAG: hypothetical protein ABSB83_02005 [Methanomassiliicoccales archaeon]|jgi:hypothetical protein